MFAFLLDFPTSHLCVEIAANAEQIYILVPEPGNLNIKTSSETLFRIFTFYLSLSLLLLLCTSLYRSQET